MDLNIIYNEDCRTGLKNLPDNSIDCCITSPPYYGLRDYNVPPTLWPAIDYSILNLPINIPEWEGCLGLEPTPEMYVGHIVQIFTGVKRVLKKEGTLWLNIGDSYWGGKGKSSQAYSTAMVGKRKTINKQQHQITSKGETRPTDNKHKFIKAKELIGIPFMVAFALRDQGYYFRQDIIWNKLNPMPESVKDRCTKSHEYILLFSKSPKYYYNYKSILELAEYDGRRDTMYKGGKKDVSCFKYERWKNKIQPGGAGSGFKGHSGNYGPDGELLTYSINGLPARNKRSVWTIASEPFNGAHFAVFPPNLIVDPIKAGCPENGIILDPFIGSGTLAFTARKLNRNYIGFELSNKNIKISNQRIYDELGMFK